MKDNKKIRFVIYSVLILFLSCILYAGFSHIKIPKNVKWRSPNSDKLMVMSQLLLVYNMDYATLPKVTPEGGNGVRDLYPLYKTGVMKRDQLLDLKYRKINLQPFSEDPTIDEFDKYHIGFSYNSTADFDATNGQPILSIQGVSNGLLDDDCFKRKNIHVLFSSGKIEKIPVDWRGRLSTKEISKEEWKLLKD